MWVRRRADGLALRDGHDTSEQGPSAATLAVSPLPELLDQRVYSLTIDQMRHLAAELRQLLGRSVSLGSEKVRQDSAAKVIENDGGISELANLRHNISNIAAWHGRFGECDNL